MNFTLRTELSSEECLERLRKHTSRPWTFAERSFTYDSVPKMERMPFWGKFEDDSFEIGVRDTSPRTIYGNNPVKGTLTLTTDGGTTIECVMNNWRPVQSLAIFGILALVSLIPDFQKVLSPRSPYEATLYLCIVGIAGFIMMFIMLKIETPMLIRFLMMTLEASRIRD